MQWVYRLVVDGRHWAGPQSRMGALPLERSRWSAPVGVRGLHLSAFVNKCSRMHLVFVLYIIEQNSLSGWDLNSGLLHPKSSVLTTGLAFSTVMIA